jgi:hypothetical protein
MALFFVQTYIIKSMKTKFIYDKPADHKLLWLLLFGFFFNYSFLVRVFLRCIMDGSAFQWANTYGIRLRDGEIIGSRIGGLGTEGHFLLLAFLVLLFVAILYLGFRRPDGFFGFLISTFLFIDFLKELQLAIYFGDEYRLVGETAGIDINVAFIGPAFAALLLIMALFYTIRHQVHHREEFKPLYTSRCKKLLLWGLALFPLTFILLRTGEQHGITDKLGILSMYIQMILLLLALIPRKEKTHQLPEIS